MAETPCENPNVPQASGIGVHQREVMGTVDQSVLLPVSYSTLTSGSTLQIQWGLFPGDTPFVRFTRSNCSPDPDRSGYNCSDHRETAPSYRDRVHLYPENGSLLLWDLQPSDSGVYVISVYSVGGSTAWRGNVTLAVYNKTDSETTSPSISVSPQTRATSITEKSIGVSVSAAVCFLIILICAYLMMTKKYTGCQRQHDSDLTEIAVQPVGGTGQVLTEESISNGELTYSMLQWSGPRPAHNIPERPEETIYAFAQKEDCR
ncbi:uncharacterized protein LOC119975690 isoform X2 [Scyliorhinus canicula]|uniref:uncharacterized protein LOC119975690 isoform X2 n=1 Tax=Scyliorhinus canicula TaxID=7830 RepID=UPI0018F3EB4C|nr:uncharacterized protein LOC119975690 isoform X2 [Scyliorhinus canicula]